MTPQSVEAILPLNIDSTMVSAFRSCPRKFYHEFVLGLRPTTFSIHLHAGARFAEALEHVYRRVWEHDETLDQALQFAYGHFLVAWGDHDPPEWKGQTKSKDRIWDAVLGYFNEWPPRADHVSPYFTEDGKATFEYTFAIPLEPSCHMPYSQEGYPTGVENDDPKMFPCHPSGEPFLYSGRFDMLGAYSGRPVWRDEKTSGFTANAQWAEQWDLRSQFLGYTWACQQGGLAVQGGIVRGISILKTKLGYIEAYKPYSTFMIERWYEQLRRDLWRIRRAWDEQYFDYNFADACTSYGNCVFAPVCGSAQPENWMSNYVVSRWNPLLKNPIETEKATA